MSMSFSINDHVALVNQLKNDLRGRLDAVQAPLLAHRELASTLRQMGLQAGNINTYTAFSAVIRAFLINLETQLTEAHKGTGYARIELNGTRDDFLFRQFRTGDIASLDKQADSLMSKYPFEALGAEVIRQSKGLEARGLANIADHLGTHLGLFVGFYNRNDPFLTFKSGRMICHFGLARSIIGTEYSHSVIDALRQMSSHFKAVEIEMGVIGLSPSIASIAETLAEGLQPVRAKLNAGLAIEAVIFKKHMHLRFTIDAADALLAFVSMHKAKNREMMGLRGVTA